MPRNSTVRQIGTQKVNFYALRITKWSRPLAPTLLSASIFISTCLTTTASDLVDNAFLPEAAARHLRESVELRGVFITSNSSRFSIHDRETNGSRWLKIGDQIDDWTIVEYKQQEKQILLNKGNNYTCLSISKNSAQVVTLSVVPQRHQSSYSNSVETLLREQLIKTRSAARCSKLEQFADAANMNATATVADDFGSNNSQSISNPVLIDQNEENVIYVVNGYDPRVLVSLNKYISK